MMECIGLVLCCIAAAMAAFYLSRAADCLPMEMETH
jgi:hypothetical protein